jgi:hyaluronan synthase
MGIKFFGILLFAVSSLATLLQWELLEQAVAIVHLQPCGRLYIWVGILLLVTNLLVFGWRVILFRRYRPHKEVSDEMLPTCTVIIPAYNEGEMVYKTLRSVLASDYPREKLQIIAVDDGSHDNTWHWIETATAEADGRLEAVRLINNCGKRKALFEGFTRSQAEIFVTIDSDSLVEANTLRCLVSPFVHDQRIGAVAGNVLVLNRQKAIIPRMLEVSFAYSFEFLRAGQSVLNSVFCTPGALSAYRRSAVMVNLDRWMKQRFLGNPAKIGEDRAMTNAILRSGYHVTFQSSAVVYTNVPVHHTGLSRMFLRWARSNIRETVVMACFIFRRFRETPALGIRVNFLLSVLRLTLPQFLLVGMFACLFWKPLLFLPHILFGAGVSGIFPALFYLWQRQVSSEAILALLYSMYWTLFLSWITPYALFTPGNSKWLTRELVCKPLPAITEQNLLAPCLNPATDSVV